MTNEQYGALKRIIRDVEEYYKILNKDFPMVLGNDIQLVQSLIDSREVKA